MKKLMIAAAIVCAAAFAQAATCAWSTGTTYKGGEGDNLNAGSSKLGSGNWGYLFVLGTDAQAATDFASLTTAKAIWEAVALDSTDYDTSKLTVNGHTYDSMDAQEFSGGTISFIDENVYAANDKVYAIIVATQGDGEDVSLYSANGAVAAIPTGGGQNSVAAVNWSSFDAEGAKVVGAATTWQSVPEPTYGLLLLLGVAGLALRRRRA